MCGCVHTHCRSNVNVDGSPYKISEQEAQEIVSKVYTLIHP